MNYDEDPATPEQADAIRRAFELGLTSKMRAGLPKNSVPAPRTARSPRRTGWILMAAVIAATTAIVGGASMLGSPGRPNLNAASPESSSASAAVSVTGSAQGSTEEQSTAVSVTGSAQASTQSTSQTAPTTPADAVQFPVQIKLPWIDVKSETPPGAIDVTMPQPVTLVGSASKACIYVISHNGTKYNLLFPRGYTADFVSESEFSVKDDSGALSFASTTSGLYLAGSISADEASVHNVCLKDTPALILAPPRD